MGLILTYLMTAAGTVAGLYRPFVGLLVYVSFSILKPDGLWPGTVPPGNYSRIVGIGLLIGWGVQALTGIVRLHLGRERYVLAALGSFLFLAVASALAAPYFEVALGFLEAMLKIVLPFVVGLTCIDSVSKLKQLTWVIVLSIGYLALQFNLSYLGGYNSLWEDGFGGLDNNCIGIALVTTLGLSLFLGLEAPSWKGMGLGLAITALVAHAILFSMSRGATLAMVATTGVAFYLLPKRPLTLSIFGLVAVLGLALAGSGVRDRFATIFADDKHRDGSAQSRIDLWGNCLDCMEKNPLLGVGPNHWGLIVSNYGWPPGKEAHTLWLQTGAELGIPALLCLVAFYVLTMVLLWPLTRATRAVPDPWLRLAARMVIASLVGFMISAQFVSLKTLELPYFVALIGAGTLKLSTMLPEAQPETWEEQELLPEEEEQAVLA